MAAKSQGRKKKPQYGNAANTIVELGVVLTFDPSLQIERESILDDDEPDEDEEGYVHGAA
jgi:hypothetical protein